MLVLGRKVNQGLWIDDKIYVLVLSVGRNSVRLGIDAPKDIDIFREELRQKQQGS